MKGHTQSIFLDEYITLHYITLLFIILHYLYWKSNFVFDYIVPGKHFLFFGGLSKFDSLALIRNFLVSAVGRFENPLEISSEANLRFEFSGISCKE